MNHLTQLLLKALFCCALIFCCSSQSFATSTRYQVTAPNPPTGSTAFCSGGTPGVYTNQAGTSNCTDVSTNTNTITWQWKRDGINISGATGTFVIGSATPSAVTLTAAQSAVLSTLSVGSHTLTVSYTPNQTNCTGTAGVAITSPGLVFYVLGPPGPITGNSVTCVGSTAQQSNTVAGGTWTAVNGTGSVSVNSSGLVTGVTAGTATVSYSTGCGTPTSKVVTINAAPTAITGSSVACIGGTTSLSHATSGGTWTSSSSAVVTVSSSGVASGVAPGSAIITYTLPVSGCQRFVTMNAIAPPSTPTVTPSAPSPVCLGNGVSATVTATASATLVSNNFNSATPLVGSVGGTWSIVNTGAASGYNWAQVAPGQYTDVIINGDGSNFMETDANLAGSGVTLTTQLVTPSFSTVGYSAAALKFNQYCRADYSGDIAAKVEYSIDGGTTWSILANYLGTTSGATTWSAASPDQNISLPAAALNVPNVKVRFYYSSTYGWYWAVDNVVVTATSVPTYSWSGVSGATGLSCTSCNNPTITPAVTGGNVYSVVATSNGCSSSASVTVSVNPVPVAIGGTPTVCFGLTSSLTNATPGGTWQSNNGNATIGATGVISGAALGTSIISYTLPTGCRATKVVTVNPLPGSITGTASACVAATTTLSNSGGGTWTSGIPGIASVGLSNGVVEGVSAGLVPITYTLATGCIRVVDATINPLPVTSITPSSSATICLGESVVLTANAPLPSFSILFQDFNAGLGGWGINSPSGDLASYWHITTATASGATGDGTPMLESNAGFPTPTQTILTSPGFSTLGYGTATLTFNQYLISAATADANVDVDYSTNNGLTWTTMLSQVGVESGTGAWSASSTPEVSVALPAGALGQSNLKLRWHYNSNYGIYWDVDNIKVTAYQPASAYSWVATGGATGLSCSSCATNTITPTATGANVYSITTTTSAGCQSVVGATVSVNPLPAAITGASDVCVNSSVTLASSDPGGSWSSADATVSVTSSTGEVAGISDGTALITYTLPTGCRTTRSIVVNPLPANIAGVQQVCEGLTTTLSNTMSGGTWSSSMPGVASIDASGIVAGIAAGFTDIYYTISATNCRITANVTVDPTPAVVTGAMQLCEGATTALADADAGGTWASGAASVATVDVSTGVVSGLLAGTSTITYQLPTGCINTAIVTVNPLPVSIAGVQRVCEGLTSTLSNSTSGGTWSSSLPGIASVDASGVVSGVAAGFTDIYYTLTATNCRIAATVTVDPTPAVITGDLQVCEGLTTALTDADASGTWTSGTTSVAAADPSTGIVSGLSAGTSIITYQLPTGCIRTVLVTVNPLPEVITGTLEVCEGLATPLGNTSAGGVWSSSATSASVDAFGVVTGITAGVETITYQLSTTCIRTTDLTVNPLPAAITGNMQVCEGLSTGLSNTTGGGTWASGSMAIATVDAASGMVGGVAFGTSTITYQLPTGCISTADVTVNPLPAAITGVQQVCEGLTTTLENTSLGGTWASSAFGIASVDAGGIVSGISAGVTTITYELPTTCIITADVTVNPLPATVAGSSQVCEGSFIALNNSTTGGDWISSNTTVAAVNTSGIVFGFTAGAATITYQLPTGCISTHDVTVNPLPAPITGADQVCEGFTTNLSNVTPTGNWSSGNFTIASVDASGIVSGIVSGTAAITYQLSTSCMRAVTVTVNAQPAPIAGNMQVCEGLSTTLVDPTTGGLWSGGAAGIATVDPSSGAVAALSAGNARVTYTLSTSCYVSTIVTVNPTPSAITGSLNTCIGSTTALSSADAGGTWSSSAPAFAPVNAATGVVSGIAVGNSVITYTLPTTCKTTSVATVNPLPAPIAGTGQACEGTTALFTNGSAGGTWISSTPLVADINTTSGSINAISAGTTLVTYTLPTGCLRTRAFVVNPLPAAITGATQVCEAAYVVLSNTTPGGIWSTSAASVAAVNTLGVVSGVSAGTTTIVYALPTGCMATTSITVNQSPTAISGATAVCEGRTTTLSNGLPGGSWATGASATATVDATLGIVTGVVSGITAVTYEMPTGCRVSRNMVVNPSPAAITGAPQVCLGSATVMSNAASGGVWTSSVPSVASINLASGMLMGLATGSVTVTYTLPAGCASMSDMVVAPIPAAVFGATNICNGQTTTLSTATTGGSWVSSDPAVATVSSGGVVTSVAPGLVNVAYTLSTGCARNAVVTINATPSVHNMTGGGNYCAGGSGVHIGLDGSTSGINYHLYSGITSIDVVPGVSGLPLDFGLIAPAGTYTVVARNSATGCTSNMAGSATVEIVAVVVPVVTLNSADAVCAGSLTTFTSVPTNGGTIPTFVWKVNGVTQLGATSATFNYTPVHGDVISTDMSSSEACATLATVSDSKTMTVNPNEMPVANVTATPGLVVCDGDAATFTVTGLYGGTSPVYTWFKNGAVAGTGITFAYTPANGDNIAVKITSNYSCRLTDEVTSATLTMATAPIYVPAIIIAANPGTHINPNTNVTLTADVALGGPSPAYQWYINSVAIPSATNATFTYSTFSNGDSVTCQVKGSGPCGLLAFNSVIMHVGPSGVGATGVGIADVKLMPNPNKGLFTVKGALATTTDEEVVLEVTNMLGQVVYRQGITAKNGLVNEQVQLNNTLANGMYMLNVKTSGDSKVFHFVLEQ